MKRIIINADDFGLSPGTNRAIQQLLVSGAITSTTLMANGPAFEDAVETILSVGQKWAIGLHVNITQFFPVGDGEGLRPLINKDGCFGGRNALIGAWMAGRISEVAIETEIRAQFDTLLEKGITPDHMDSHQHAHAIPLVTKAINNVAKEKGVPVRVLRPFLQRPGWKRAVKAGFLNWITTRTNLEEKSNTVSNMMLASIFSTGHSPSVKAYSELLSACPGEVIELMVHPADVDADHEALTRISDVSRQDYEVLSSSKWSEFQQSCGHDFVTFSDFS